VSVVFILLAFFEPLGEVGELDDEEHDIDGHVNFPLLVLEAA